jgi:two-component system, chemotaxis family, chemotaxis protein CheY
MALNLLIVDDSAVMRAMIIKTLRMANLPIGEIHEAANGAEGLSQLETNWVDLCVADINMPVMDGEEMIQAMHDNPALSDIPIIVVSTEGSETRINRLVQHGVRFVHKPFAPETIRDTIKESLADYGEYTSAESVGADVAGGDGTDF